MRQPAKLVRTLPFEAVQDRAGVDAATWDLLAPNLSSVREAADWLPILDGDIAPVIEAPQFIAAALAALPAGELTTDTWRTWTKGLQEQTGRKGRALFMPLRLALTGRSQGPDMAGILARIGRDKVVARLGGQGGQDG